MIERTVVHVAETMRTGVGAAVLWACGVAEEGGYSVEIAAPLRPDEMLDPNRRVRHLLDLPRSAYEIRRVVEARRQLRAIIAGREVLLHAHGLRASLCTVGLGSTVLTHHGTTSLPGEASLKRLMRSVAFRLLPLFLCAATTVWPEAPAGWRSLFIPSPIALRHLAERPPLRFADPLTLFWLGRVSPQKRFTDFVNLVTRLAATQPDVRGVVLGACDDPEWASLVADRACGRIDLRGHVEDPMSHLTDGAVVCLFSNFEGRPFALQEAMAIGVPIVASELPGIRWLVGDDYPLSVNGDDAAAEVLKLWSEESWRCCASFLRSRALTLLPDRQPAEMILSIYGETQ